MTRTRVVAAVCSLLVLVAIAVTATTAYAVRNGEEFHSCGDCHQSTLLGASSHDFHGDCNRTDTNFRPTPYTCHQDDAAGACDLHDPCQESHDLDVSEVSRLAQEGVEDSLVYLVRRHKKVLSYNAARNAVQILDCGGHVVAHYPVMGTSTILRDAVAAM